MTDALDTSERFRLCEHLFLKGEAGNTLAFDPRSMAVHQLNDSMVTVAQMCDGTNSCEDMVIALVERFGLKPHDAACEVYCALKLLRDEGLLGPGG